MERFHPPHKSNAPEKPPANELMVNGVWLDLEENTCRVFGEEIRLSSTQTTILHLLMSTPGTFYSREQIMDAIGENVIIDERSIDSYIKRLRKKLFPRNNDAGRAFIEVKYRAGYRVPDLRR